MSFRGVRFLENWHHFLRLPPEDRPLVLSGIGLLCLTMLGLRKMSFRRCKDFIQKFSAISIPPRRIEVEGQSEARDKIVCMMNAVVLNGPWRPNCLERSLALWWLLRLNGVDSELHIGGRKSEGRFEAHSWVESAGQVLNDSVNVHAHYTRFDAPIVAAEEGLRTTARATSQAARKAASR